MRAQKEVAPTGNGMEVARPTASSEGKPIEREASTQDWPIALSTPALAEAAGRTTEQIAIDAQEGQVLAGKYRIEGVIGKGGMGLVLKARHIGLDELVAIKVLRASMLAVPGMVQRFLREARAASKIKSEHVGRVTDVDTLPSGVPYMVMEYLDGNDLLALLRRRVGPFSIEESVRYVFEACDAIADAHSHGIVHRDLKPSNLFLARRRDGRDVVKVLDFGISKLQQTLDDVEATKTGQLLGSPKYMSPEQMVDTHNVDGRADLWALGAILYEFVTGRPPFMAQSTAMICSLVLNAQPRPPSEIRPDLPGPLEAIILRCLEKQPSQRFASVKELAEALAPFIEPIPRSHTPVSVPLLSTATPTPSITPAPAVVTPIDPAAHAGDLSTMHILSGEARRQRLRRWSLRAAAALVLAGVGLVLMGRDRGARRVEGPSAATSAAASPPSSGALMVSSIPPPEAAPADDKPSAERAPIPAPPTTAAKVAVPAGRSPSPSPPISGKKQPKEDDPFGGVRQLGGP